jgi:O-antigen/teichoic acid export membrane protein
MGFLTVSAELYIKFNAYFLMVVLFIRVPFMEKRFIFPIKNINRSHILSFLKFAIPQVYGFTGLYLINWMDVYFIRRYCTLDELGAYQFLYSIFMKFGSFALVLNPLLFPKMLSWKESNQKKLEQYLRNGPCSLLLSTGFIVAFVIITYKPIFSVFFGEKYSVAYPAFNILLWSLPFYYITYLFVPVLNSYDKVSYIQTVNIVAALSNLAIDAIFVVQYGIIAAALGTFIAYSLKLLLLVLCVNKMFNPNYKILTITCFILLMFVSFYAIKSISNL